jgi:hypothetical protein
MSSLRVCPQPTPSGYSNSTWADRVPSNPDVTPQVLVPRGKHWGWWSAAAPAFRLCDDHFLTCQSSSSNGVCACICVSRVVCHNTYDHFVYDLSPLTSVASVRMSSSAGWGSCDDPLLSCPSIIGICTLCSSPSLLHHRFCHSMPCASCLWSLLSSRDLLLLLYCTMLLLSASLTCCHYFPSSIALSYISAFFGNGLWFLFRVCANTKPQVLSSITDTFQKHRHKHSATNEGKDCRGYSINTHNTRMWRQLLQSPHVEQCINNVGYSIWLWCYESVLYFTIKLYEVCTLLLHYHCP